MVTDIARFIDHTVLKPSTTKEDIVTLCEEAIRYSFFAVCVPPCYVRQAKELLGSSSVKVATVIGFPMGYSMTKAAEITLALKDGADELDVVQNIAALKSGDADTCEHEISACTRLVHDSGKKIKIILETGLLTREEISDCCDRYAAYKPDFIKTSTGYTDTGATVETVRLLKELLPDDIGIKASGGIRSFAFAKELLEAGATRIGCSASVQILEQSKLS